MLVALLLVCVQGRIDGVATSASGAPLGGARVIAGELGHATLFFNTPEEMFVGMPGVPESETARFGGVTRCDDEGRFAFDGLTPGEYSLIVADSVRGIALGSAHVEEGASSRLKLVARAPARLRGSVKGVKFDPTRHVLELAPSVPRANVSFTPRLEVQGDSWTFRSTALPADFEWRLQGSEIVFEHDYRATLFGEPAMLRAGEESELVLSTNDGPRVRGRVLDASGAAVSGTSVLATSRGSLGRQRGAVSDAEGRFEIGGLEAGAWRLEGARWSMRELPGCGAGPQELSGDDEFVVDGELVELDLRVIAERPPPRVGDVVADFEATLLDGRRLRLSSLRGKVVLIDFWATWCGMCRAEFPRLVQHYERYAAQGRFEIVGVSFDEDAELVRRFLASRGLRWPQTALGIARNNPLARLYNVNSTPSTILIGPDGVVVALNLTGAELRDEIARLVAR